MTTYAISTNYKQINYNNDVDPFEFDFALEMLEMEWSFGESIEYAIELLQKQIINGADIIDNDTGEVLLTFENGSTIPTYNATDITF